MCRRSVGSESKFGLNRNYSFMNFLKIFQRTLHETSTQKFIYTINEGDFVN